MITLLAVLALLQVIVVLAFVRVVFDEFPRSAIEHARNDLFKIRAELFALAESGELRFDSPAYYTLRSKINGLLRFADDISFWSLLLARVSMPRSSRTQADAMRAGTDHALGQQKPEMREKLQRMESRAYEVMFQLMVKRSVAMSLLVYTLAAIAAPFLLAAAFIRSVRRGLDWMRAPAPSVNLVHEMYQVKRVRVRLYRRIDAGLLSYIPKAQAARLAPC